MQIDKGCTERPEKCNLPTVIVTNEGSCDHTPITASSAPSLARVKWSKTKKFSRPGSQLVPRKYWGEGRGLLSATCRGYCDISDMKQHKTSTYFLETQWHYQTCCELTTLITNEWNKNRNVDKVDIFLVPNHIWTYFVKHNYSFRLNYPWHVFPCPVTILRPSSITGSRPRPLPYFLAASNAAFYKRQKRSRVPENIKIRTLHCFCFVTFHNPSLIAAAYMRFH